MPPEPCVVVILGVAGDLGRTTLVPSLYALGCQRLLPEPFAMLGVARRDWDDETFRDAMRPYAQEKKALATRHGSSLPSVCLLWAGISIAPGDAIQPAGTTQGRAG